MTRIGLLGAGWAGAVHAMASSVTPGATVTWVGSRTAEGASRLAEMGHVPFGTYAELPARLDAVVVATPPDHHAEAVTTAARRGLAVLVEKPLAATCAEADAMIHAVDDAGVVAGLAENLLFAPAVDRALAHRPSMGPLDRLDLGCRQPPPTWGHYAETLPAGGVLFDLGAHPLALVLAVAGSEPVAVRAALSSTRPDGADDDATATVRFADGLEATVSVSWRGEPESDPVWHLEAASATSVIRLDLLPHLALSLDGEDATPATVAADLPDPRLEQLGYLGQLRGFVDVTAGRGGRVCPLGFGRAVLELTCAAYLSAGRGGAEVALPYDGPRDLTPLQLWRGA